MQHCKLLVNQAKPNLRTFAKHIPAKITLNRLFRTGNPSISEHHSLGQHEITFYPQLHPVGKTAKKGRICKAVSFVCSNSFASCRSLNGDGCATQSSIEGPMKALLRLITLWSFLSDSISKSKLDEFNHRPMSTCPSCSHLAPTRNPNLKRISGGFHGFSEFEHFAPLAKPSHAKLFRRLLQ